jgi:hypothetical protein
VSVKEKIPRLSPGGVSGLRGHSRESMTIALSMTRHFPLGLGDEERIAACNYIAEKGGRVNGSGLRGSHGQNERVSGRIKVSKKS